MMAIPPLHGAPSPDLKITKHSPCYWRATFDYPPLNLFNNDTFLALLQLVEQLDVDPDVKVVVFDSTSTDYYIALFDLVKGFDALSNCQTLFNVWPGFVLRLACLPVVTITSIRGRVRGIGSEFLQACDIRFASREPAVLGQPEVGAGLIPVAGDWNGCLVTWDETAELYGWINRAVADDLLDGFVDKFSQRIAGFDGKPLMAAKRLVNDRAGLPRMADMTASGAAFLECTGFPETQARGALLNSRGLQEAGDLELRLGHHVALLAPAIAVKASEW